LQRAGLTPADVDYVNAHGTGTIDNDLSEGRALSRVFGEALPLISSTKRFFGHTLGAAGAIETVACILALQNQWVPGTLGLRHRDPEIPIKPLLSPVNARVKTVLNNSIGFGGACSTLVIREVSREGMEP
jgi:3-oxoacyl-(acyl-carrier-protein) synthase